MNNNNTDPFQPFFKNVIEDDTDRELLDKLLENKENWKRILEEDDTHSIKEMVLHDFQHTMNVYHITGDLIDLFQREELLKALNALELYLLGCAIFLHDCGMSGGRLIDINDDDIVFTVRMDMELTRKYHGLIGAQKVLSGNLFEIEDALDDHIAQIIRYHQKKVPLNMSKETWEFTIRRNNIKRVFEVERINEKQRINYNNKWYMVRLKLLAAILRFTDGLDVNRNRIHEDKAFKHNIQKEIDRRLEEIEQVRNGVFKYKPHSIEDLKKEIDFLSFLVTQPIHYKKHKIIRKVDLDLNEFGTQLFITN